MFLAFCHKGDLAGLQTVHREDWAFITQELVRDRGCVGEKLACIKGHLETVEWLVNTFQLDVSDICAGARARGHSEPACE